MKGRGLVVLDVVALCAVLSFAGCGSDSNTNAAATDEASTPLSKPQFVKQANKICTNGLKAKDQAVSAAVQEMGSQSKTPSDPKAVEEIVEETIVPAYQNIVDQLGRLGAPKKDRARVDKMIGEFESALQVAESDPIKATKKNPFLTVDEAAAAYGMEACVL